MQNVLIIGFGISGRSAASLCKRNGDNVFIYDDKGIDELTLDLTTKNLYRFIDICYLSSHASIFDFAVVSPGVLPSTSIYKIIKEKRIPMISEIELGYRYCKGRIIAITGTNGKTSTSYICSRILNHLGVSQCVCGNMGIGFAEVIPQIEQNQNVILEVSAQQLHTTNTFKPYISVITNINHEHQADYCDYTDYVEDKTKIYANQDESDFCIINLDDKELVSRKSDIKANLLGFSKHKRILNGASYEDGRVYVDIKGSHKEFLLGNDLRMDYIEHILVAVLVLEILRVSYDVKILKMISSITFEGRLETFKNYNNRVFINDSKATNPYSTIFALNCFNDVVLICGSNLKKKSDFSDLINKIEKKGCWAILYRESGAIIAEELQRKGYNRYIYVDDLESAIETAYNCSKKGDAIIFSPAGNSSPLYTNHCVRGTVFKRMVGDFILEKTKCGPNSIF